MLTGGLLFVHLYIFLEEFKLTPTSSRLIGCENYENAVNED